MNVHGIAWNDSEVEHVFAFGGESSNQVNVTSNSILLCYCVSTRYYYCWRCCWVKFINYQVFLVSRTDLRWMCVRTISQYDFCFVISFSSACCYWRLDRVHVFEKFFCSFLRFSNIICEFFNLESVVFFLMPKFVYFIIFSFHRVIYDSFKSLFKIE